MEEFENNHPLAGLKLFQLTYQKMTTFVKAREKK